MPLLLTTSQTSTLLLSVSPSTLLHLSTLLSTALQSPLTQTPHRTSTTTPLDPSNSPTSSNPSATRTLFMPCTYPPSSTTSIKTVSLPPNSSPNATLSLFSASSGSLLALLPASDLTAFRTALVSLLLPYLRLKSGLGIERITIFGAGLQVRWLLHLIPKLIFPDDAPKIAVFTRGGADSAQERLGALFSSVEFHSLDDRAKVEELLRESDAVFCCTPSTEPLFPRAWLKTTSYVSLIGSYRPDMVEVEPELLKEEGWGVVVDKKEACWVESGEIIRSGIKEERVEELGEVWGRFMGGDRVDGKGEGDRGELEERYKGGVVFKCVGTAVMDLVAGQEVVRWAREKGVGMEVDGWD